MLIPFQASIEPTLTPVDRIKADCKLKKAMKKASAAAGTIIELGSVMFSSEGVRELEGILTRVSSLLPHASPQRVFVSYSWLLFATLKVIINNYCNYCGENYVMSSVCLSHLYLHMHTCMPPCISKILAVCYSSYV